MWYAAASLFFLGFLSYLGALVNMNSLSGEIFHDAGTSLMLTGVALSVLWSRRPWASGSAPGPGADAGAGPH